MGETGRLQNKKNTQGKTQKTENMNQESRTNKYNKTGKKLKQKTHNHDIPKGKFKFPAA